MVECNFTLGVASRRARSSRSRCSGSRSRRPGVAVACVAIALGTLGVLSLADHVARSALSSAGRAWHSGSRVGDRLRAGGRRVSRRCAERRAVPPATLSTLVAARAAQTALLAPAPPARRRGQRPARVARVAVRWIQGAALAAGHRHDHQRGPRAHARAIEPVQLAVSRRVFKSAFAGWPTLALPAVDAPALTASSGRDSERDRRAAGPPSGGGAAQEVGRRGAPGRDPARPRRPRSDRQRNVPGPMPRAVCCSAEPAVSRARRVHHDREVAERGGREHEPEGVQEPEGLGGVVSATSKESIAPCSGPREESRCRVVGWLGSPGSARGPPPDGSRKRATRSALALPRHAKRNVLSPRSASHASFGPRAEPTWISMS
jgi:hypothetical protein